MTFQEFGEINNNKQNENEYDANTDFITNGPKRPSFTSHSRIFLDDDYFKDVMVMHAAIFDIITIY